MKIIRKVTVLICILAITASVCACGKKDPLLEKYAGTYTFYSMLLNGQHVIFDEFEGTTTILEANGKGSLDWGEDNKGPISQWTVDDDDNGKLTVKAGVATMDVEVHDGIMFIDLGDDMISVYVTEDADTSSMPRVTIEEFAVQ